MRRSGLALLLAGAGLHGQSLPQLGECLDALAGTASNFAATAPGLMAQETLDQRGRRGYIEILRGRKDRIKDLSFTLPQDFHSHHVISSYALAEIGQTRALHEIRTVLTIDGEAVKNDGEARHALSIGLESAEDDTKRRLLENLDRNLLEGAVTDFGQLILLFTRRRQHDYRFSGPAAQHPGDDAVIVIDYRQVSGSEGLTFFKQTTAERQPASGQIWLRARDLLPVRIIFNSSEFVSKKFTVRTEAVVDYKPSPFGLVPERVMHKQFLNSALMVENDFRYADFHSARTLIP